MRDKRQRNEKNQQRSIFCVWPSTRRQEKNYEFAEERRRVLIKQTLKNDDHVLFEFINNNYLIYPNFFKRTLELASGNF